MHADLHRTNGPSNCLLVTAHAASIELCSSEAQGADLSIKAPQAACSLWHEMPDACQRPPARMDSCAARPQYLINALQAAAVSRDARSLPVSPSKDGPDTPRLIERPRPMGALNLPPAGELDQGVQPLSPDSFAGTPMAGQVRRLPLHRHSIACMISPTSQHDLVCLSWSAGAHRRDTCLPPLSCGGAGSYGGHAAHASAQPSPAEHPRAPAAAGLGVP